MELEIEQDEAFQRREWRFERLGWAVLTLFVVAGLIGALGKGPVAWATASSDDGVLTVEHNRVTRLLADDEVTLSFGPDAVQDGTVTVEVTGSWYAQVELRSITPQPDAELLVPDGMVLELPVSRAGEELTVELVVRATGVGAYSAQFAVPGSPPVTFRQIVLP